MPFSCNCMILHLIDDIILEKIIESELLCWNLTHTKHKEKQKYKKQNFFQTITLNKWVISPYFSICELLSALFYYIYYLHWSASLY
jgi:hypothetical protein